LKFHPRQSSFRRRISNNEDNPMPHAIRFHQPGGPDVL